MLRYQVPSRRLARRYGRFAEPQRMDVHIPLDVTVDDDSYLITAFVPGVSAEDVKIEILDDSVSLEGEFPKDENEDARYLLQERPSGSFHRSLKLPTGLDAAGAEAEVVNGILFLRVPKVEEAKAKQIKVKVK